MVCVTLWGKKLLYEKTFNLKTYWQRILQHSMIFTTDIKKSCSKLHYQEVFQSTVFSNKLGSMQAHSSASIAFTDYSEGDILVWWYTPVNCGGKQSPGVRS